MDIQALFKRARETKVTTLVYRTIATLGTASILGGGVTQSVQAQPTPNHPPQLIAQVNTLNGSPLPAGGGISSGRFTYPGGGSFYRGYLNNNGNGNYQGSFYYPHGIYQGTFYYPNSGGNFHGLFYNPGTGKILQGNFYNPGPGSINQGTVYAPLQGNPIYQPTPSNVYPGYYGYSPSFSCYNQADLHDWGNGCFSQGGYKRALEYYTQAIQKNPQLVNAYNRRALVRFILGDKQGTIADLRKAASLYLARGDKSSYQQTLETIKEVQAEPTSGANR